MQSPKGNLSIKQDFCPWAFSEGNCRIRYLTFVSGQSVMRSCKSNNTGHDLLGESCEDHKRNILPIVCFSVPTEGNAAYAAYLLQAFMVSGWLGSHCVRFLLAERKKAWFYPLASVHKMRKISLNTKQKNLPSKPTNLTNNNIGTLLMCQWKLSN